MKQSNDFHQEIIVSSAEWGDHSKLSGCCPLHVLGLFSVLNILLILQILNLYPSFKSIECQFFCLFVYSITFLGLLNLLSWNRQGRFPLVMVLGNQIMPSKRLLEKQQLVFFFIILLLLSLFLPVCVKNIHMITLTWHDHIRGIFLFIVTSCNRL